jgi:selenocysteine lyase/cysteine desulfurase
MHAIAAYEQRLAADLLDTLESVDGVTVHGLRDRARLDARVPTVCFSVAGLAPADVASRMAEAGIAVRHGNMYAPRLMARLGVEEACRVSLVHYNTTEEIDRFGEALRQVR